MRIWIDVRKFSDFGIGTYVQNILHALDTAKEYDVVMFASAADEQKIRQSHRGTVVVNNSPKYSVSELFTLAAQANGCGVDLFHEPHYTLPFGVKGRKVVTIFDLIHLQFPRYFSVVQRTYAYAMIRHACSAADAVLVGSEFTKGELLRRFPVPEKKIHVTPLGVSRTFGAGVDQLKMVDFWEARGIHQPVILYVGSLKPHKNLPVLFDAMVGVRKEMDARIVLVGERLDQYPQLLAHARRRGIEDAVVSVGRLKEEELVMAYQSAGIVVLPSLCEGFGFPIVEGNASRTPVIGARAGSIPEVMGDAGLLFDPSDPEDLARAILRTLKDVTLRQALIEKGVRNVERFSWDQCAKQTFAIYASLTP